MAFFLAFSTVVSAQNDRAVIDKVVATVGSEIVMLSELQEQFSYAKQQNPNLPADFMCMTLQNIIVQKMLVNQAKLDSVEVKDDEVETQIAARIDRLLAYFNQDQKALEDFYGQSLEQIRETTRNDMRNQMLSQRMESKITEKASVTPSEVKLFFDNIPKDSLPYFNAEVEIREIVYKPQINTKERESARQRIAELRQRIVEGGDDFGILAKKYSEDPGSAAQNGDLGFQKRGTFVPAFEAAAYRLENDQISPVIESEFGFHIIQMLERRGNLIRCRHILIKPTLTQEDLDKAKSVLDSVAMMIKDSTLTFGAAVKKYGDKNQQSFNNDGRVANPRSGNTFFEVADLDTDVYFAIDGLQPGQLSKPILFHTPDGSQMYRLIQLVSRSKPHKADLKQDYSKIQDAALQQKKGDFTEKWVLEKLRTTYLGIGDRFAQCPNLQEMLNIKNQK
ncbi:MAG: peptidylprolyl isomerase [Saprospiraceae bacterium]|nr:peptidylprolyl isomerase [Saprospiraceae bacterium]